MKKISLKVKTRKEEDNVKNLRKEGLVPAVVYGSGLENKSLLVDALDFKRVYGKAGENTIIEIDVDGKEKINVLIHDVQLDVLSGEFIHADLFRVDMKKKIETDIPLEFAGVSAAVKELGGVLVKNLNTIPVRCLPGDIPHSFEVDLSLLGTFEDHIAISSVDVPENVQVTLDEETIIASVTPPRSEEELSSLDEKVEEDVSEVEGVEKKEEEGAEEKAEEKTEEKTSE